jgi:hypothetical protein
LIFIIVSVLFFSFDHQRLTQLMNTQPMNMTTFWTTLAVGALVALLASWRFSRTGSHPRFRPAMGVVLMVFMAIMGVVAFLAMFFGKMVGNKLPPVMTAEERKVLEAEKKTTIPLTPAEPSSSLVPPATELPLPTPTEELPAPAESVPAEAPVEPAVEPVAPAPTDELPEPAPSTPEP